jgi:hypothetical protein
MRYRELDGDSFFGYGVDTGTGLRAVRARSPAKAPDPG